VFAAGDTVTGASLVVNAIASGRKVAKEIDRFLKQ
jgi:NADPH-dependent glutamate synthase beta subunit-like oxidoreductase